MKLKEVLRECQEKGYPITSQGLYDAGRRYGFIITERGTRENPNKRVLDREKFEEWLNGALEEVPEGYIKISQASKKYELGLTKLYNLIKLNVLESKQIGSGKGIYYLNEKQLVEYLRNDKTNSPKWR